MGSLCSVMVVVMVMLNYWHLHYRMEECRLCGCKKTLSQ